MKTCTRCGTQIARPDTGLCLSCSATDQIPSSDPQRGVDDRLTGIVKPRAAVPSL